MLTACSYANNEQILLLFLSDDVRDLQGCSHCDPGLCRPVKFQPERPGEIWCSIHAVFTCVCQIVRRNFDEDCSMHVPLVNKLVDPENRQFLMETNLPTPIWQGLCWFTGGYVALLEQETQCFGYFPKYRPDFGGKFAESSFAWRLWEPALYYIPLYLYRDGSVRNPQIPRIVLKSPG